MKQIIQFIIVMIAWVSLGVMFNPPLPSVSAQSTLEDDNSFFYQWVDVSTPTTVVGDIVKEDVVTPNDGIIKRMLRLFNLDQFTTNSDAWALEYAKSLINLVLGFTSFIAFLVILYGFGQMLFSEDEEGIATARKVVRSAAIAIAILAVSWLVVSFLFSIYNAVSGI